MVKRKAMKSIPKHLTPKPKKIKRSPTRLRYEAAERYRADGISVPLSKNGATLIKKDRQYMVRINRDLQQNNPIYKSIINSLVTNVLGVDGASVIWHVDNETDKDWLKKQFKIFNRIADYTGRFSLTELERIILQELLVVGEVLLLKKRKSLQLQIIETERIKTVNSDNTGKIISFDIEGGTNTEVVTVLAKDAIYIYNPERYSSNRGLGVLWSACDLINTESYILRSSAKAMGIASRHTVAIEKEDGEQQMANYNEGLAGNTPPVADATGTDVETPTDWVAPDDYEYPEDRIFDVEDTTMFIGKKGEKINLVNQNGVPNGKIGDHILTFSRIVASSVGIDAASAVLGDFSKYNYSSSKAAHIMMTATVKRIQSRLINQGYNKILRWLVGSWMANESLPLPKSDETLDSFEIILPIPSIVDEKGQAEAAQMTMELGISTHEEQLLARNKDRKAYLKARAEEFITAYQTVEYIKQQTDGNLIIPYQVLCGLPLTIAATVATEQQDDGDSSNDDNSKPSEKDNVEGEDDE